MAKVKYVTRAKDGLYRYNRRVPDDCQKALRKRLWNLSLGRDYDAAVQRAASLRREHDGIIARLRDPASAGDEKVRLGTARTSARIAELENRDAPEAIEGEEGSVEETLGALWRRIPDEMTSAQDDPNEYKQLVMMQALAFGDDSRSGGQTIQLPPPTATVERMQYDAYRAMLTQRLEQLAPLPDHTPPEMRISALIEQYIKVQALRPNTARSYRHMVERLVRAHGDHGLRVYDRDKLRQHRDALEADPAISTQSVEKHFAPLKALWRWAADEYDELAELQFPRVRLSKRDTTVEESRWQAFNDDEVKLVWKALNEAWGPDSKSRIRPRRRKSFLMAVRVMLYTGMRPAEVFQLKTGDVENGVLMIRRTKTTPRKLPISKHISDLPDFLEKGGFERERESKTIAVTMSDNFTKVIRAAGLKNDRHVLYSLKDTLVDRLQRQDGMTDDIIRGIIGHVIGQGKLRHYKTPFGETQHGRAAMKKALDAIEYW
ncbi:Phage integrase, N-terminal SAM-like domain [Roseivivax halotolerans]|uniref:Phage integrase, N-terminal SAM-like domain n=1 Tax=Roseivivax halotolerans TaxID=93684 RepID=A0A1I5ZJ37_9RHOB|nr:DUF6538 domain-containing protein [Roseivivax halotolerans]SFQ56476.1 Phage integrase, N-terminal SAM-like domain [Roseivivax halotolerans]